jgi:phosphoribosylformylglycinamidine cyclo-ligase
MTTYKDSGVDIEMGDECSRIAYEAATATFASRQGMIGQPMKDLGGFSGALDMGDYYLVQNDDGVGTKIAIAEKINKFDTLGYDLIAMVADDAACMGAETISVTNTLDVNKVDAEKIQQLMTGLKKAASEQKIVVPGGEIAELGDRLNGYIWNATAVGVLAKDKMISGKDIKPGDKIIGLRSAGIRSNGFSLVRHILKSSLGENWYNQPFDDTVSWGEKTLTPSVIYSNTILQLHGRYGEPKQADLKAVVHVTGGGIAGNLNRIIKKTEFGAKLKNLPQPPEVFKKLIELGNVAKDEAYKTWNMGVGMLIVSNEFDKIAKVCEENGITSEIIGEITEEPGIQM